MLRCNKKSKFPVFEAVELKCSHKYHPATDNTNKTNEISLGWDVASRVHNMAWKPWLSRTEYASFCKLNLMEFVICLGLSELMKTTTCIWCDCIPVLSFIFVEAKMCPYFSFWCRCCRSVRCSSPHLTNMRAHKNGSPLEVCKKQGKQIANRLLNHTCSKILAATAAFIYKLCLVFYLCATCCTHSQSALERFSFMQVASNLLWMVQYIYCSKTHTSFPADVCIQHVHTCASHALIQVMLQRCSKHRGPVQDAHRKPDLEEERLNVPVLFKLLLCL